MITKNYSTPEGPNKREVTMTIGTELAVARTLNLLSLSEADNDQLREVYNSLTRIDEARGAPKITRIVNQHGSYDLKREELGDDLFNALRPEGPEINSFDPMYSTVEFVIRVMEEDASSAYTSLINSEDYSALDCYEQLEIITSAAKTIVSVTLEPPSLA